MQKETINTIPIVPLREITVMPHEILSFDIGRNQSQLALTNAMQNGGKVFIATQKDARKNAVTPDDIYEIGTYSLLKQIMRLPAGETIRVFAEGVCRAKISNVSLDQTYMTTDALCFEDDECDPYLGEAYRRHIAALLSEYTSLTPRLTAEALSVIDRTEGFGAYTDAVATFTMLRPELRRNILEEFDVIARMKLLIDMLSREIEIMKLDRRIQQETKKVIDKNQREYYLREQMKVIKKELGEDGAEVDELRERIDKKKLPDLVLNRLQREIDRYATLPAGSHEAPSSRAFMECVLDLPFEEATIDNIDIERAREILDRDHFGMKQVKDRIIEHLSVAKRTGKLTGQIICFVGPPGVGKTSISASIAEAVNRKFVRMSLGGIDDEAEIRGHRRTYIGAMPGRIITAMRQAGTKNPVLLFDEIDKLNKNIHGDPAAAMLEVLDSAQNSTFRDHFVEIPYDLSNVMFITTANSKDTIPRPLLDRMEMIEVSGYLETEKLEIAKRHLLKKELIKHNISESALIIPDDILLELIRCYTLESGVRELDRVIASVCRKASCDFLEGATNIVLTEKLMEQYLGARKYRHDSAQMYDQTGTANGLAWTAVGGELLKVEAQFVKGSGKFELTGQLGDVMRESAATALTYIKAHVFDMGFDDKFFAEHDLHIHVPEGAVKKDGPSAGITMMTAIYSALTDRPIDSKLAMTGEISLRGHVLPVGGLREKLLAALRGGINTVIVPNDNRVDVEEIESEITDKLDILYVSEAEPVYKRACHS
ncbi:MAG: endopeptidase La [Clostridia bacterium]